MSVKTGKTKSNKKVANNSKKSNELKISKGAVLAIAGIAVVILASFIFLGLGNNKESKGIATVNGEIITQEDVEKSQFYYSLQSGNQIPENQALEALIAETVFVQEANERGISVTESEAEEAIKQQASQNGRSLEDIKADLKQRGGDYEFFVSIYQKQIAMERFAEEVFEENDVSEVSEDEIMQFYENNKEALFQGQEVLPYETVASQLETIILQQKQQQVLTGYIQDLRSQADIEIYE